MTLKCPECGWVPGPNFGRFRCPECLTVFLMASNDTEVRVINPAVKAITPRPSAVLVIKAEVPHNQCECIVCGRQWIDAFPTIADTVLGKARYPVERAEWVHSRGDWKHVMVSKLASYPIKRRGPVCRECLTTPGLRLITREANDTIIPEREERP